MPAYAPTSLADILRREGISQGQQAAASPAQSLPPRGGEIAFDPSMFDELLDGLGSQDPNQGRRSGNKSFFGTRFSGHVPASDVGDPGFANMLLEIFKQRRSLQDQANQTAGQPPLGGGTPNQPFPDLFRYSPQARPNPQAPGIAGVGPNPVRPPGTVSQGAGGGGTLTDQGASLPPAFSQRGRVEGINKALSAVQLWEGGPTFDFSDPSNLELPGITTGNYNPFPIRPEAPTGGRFAQGRATPFGGSSLGHAAQRRRNNPRPQYHIPGVHHDPKVRELNQFEALPQFSKNLMRRVMPHRVPTHPMNDMLKRFGIDASFVTALNALKAGGSI